jgi:hypothetical protein
MEARPPQSDRRDPGSAARRGLIACGLALLAGPALSALPALGAPEGASSPLPLTLSDRQAVATLGEGTVRRADGLFLVPIPGGDLLTHGPDPRASLGGPAGEEVGFRPGDAEREPRCATGHHQHVLYGRVASARDRYAQVAPELRAAVRRMNAVLNRDSIESGGPTADYKVRCEDSGEIAVGTFTARGVDFSSIVQGARAAGYDSGKADYTIFFDAVSSACGMGSYEKDERLAKDNANNEGGGYAVAYRDCWLTEIPMHENAHTQGAVQHGAPNSTGSGGHCNDEQDVMCYSPDGGDRRQGGTVKRCEGDVRFDCDNDDYFNTAPQRDEYLASHWNLGSRLNRFIAFGGEPKAPAQGRACRAKGQGKKGRGKRRESGKMRRRGSRHDERSRGKRACRDAGKARRSS